MKTELDSQSLKTSLKFSQSRAQMLLDKWGELMESLAAYAVSNFVSQLLVGIEWGLI